MQRIRIVFEAPRNRSSGDVIEAFRRKLRRFYKGVRLEGRIQPSDYLEIPTDLLEAAHDAASRAEEEQRKTGSNFVVYLRPLGAAIEGNEGPTDGDDEVSIILIAVAHCRGIGAFRVSRPLAQTVVPPEICLELIEQTTEAENVMRPRTKDPDNEPAAHLSTHVYGILEEIVPHV